jgi:hypothetical protein
MDRAEVGSVGFRLVCSGLPHFDCYAPALSNFLPPVEDQTAPQLDPASQSCFVGAMIWAPSNTPLVTRQILLTKVGASFLPSQEVQA